MPSRRKADHPCEECRFVPIHAVLHHVFFGDFLKLLAIIALVTERAVLETITAVPRRLAYAGIFFERHQTAFTGVFHGSMIQDFFRAHLMLDSFSHGATTFRDGKR